MSVPRRFVGAWERESLAISGDAVPGIGRAWWIESGGTYVDVRAPGTIGRGTSFGGRSAWRAPALTWHHDLDLHPRPGAVDRGTCELLDDRIIERGTGIDGGRAPYEECWRRLPSTDLVIAVATHGHGLAVRVGDHAALIVAGPDAKSHTARAWMRANGTWSETITLGAPGNSPAPSGSGWTLTRGWRAR
jgi:Protein HRI1